MDDGNETCQLLLNPAVHGAEVEMASEDVDMAAAETPGTDLDDMKRRLKEMEEESSALREMQAKVEREMVSVQDPSAATISQENREEINCRSVFVGNMLESDAAKGVLYFRQSLLLLRLNCPEAAMRSLQLAH